MPPRRLARLSALALAYLGASYAGFALGGPWNILLGLANGLAVAALIVGGRGAPRLVAATILPAGALAGLAGADSVWLGLAHAAGSAGGLPAADDPARPALDREPRGPGAATARGARRGLVLPDQRGGHVAHLGLRDAARPGPGRLGSAGHARPVSAGEPVYNLKHLEFDYLKIDGEFGRLLPTSQIDQLIVRSAVEIAHGLGKQTIVEHVGDDETIDILHSYGVHFAQGFHVGAPAPLEELDLGPSREPAWA